MKEILLSHPKLIDIAYQDMHHTRLPRCIHRHDDRVEVMLILNGQGIYQIGGRTYAAKAGDMLVYDADTLHDEAADQSTGIEILGCSIAEVQLKGSKANHLMKENACPVIRAGSYRQQIRLLMEIIHSVKDDGHTAALDQLMDNLLSSLVLFVYQSGVENDEMLNKRTFEIGMMVQKYIDEHYLEEIDIPQIAAALKIGESYVSRTFKKTSGYSVAQYIIRRRIGEAQSWLLMSNLSVTDIAMKVGYNSVSNFHSTFRRIVGMSPQQYRKYWQQEK